MVHVPCISKLEIGQKFITQYNKMEAIPRKRYLRHTHVAGDYNNDVKSDQSAWLLWLI